MPYLLLKQGSKKKYLQCKKCNSDFFSNSDSQNQQPIGTKSLLVKATCKNCGEKSFWRFTNAQVEETDLKNNIIEDGETVSCKECGEIAGFMPPPKTVKKELVVKFRCKNKHITVKTIPLK